MGTKYTANVHALL